MHRIVNAALIAAGLAVALPAGLLAQAKSPVSSASSTPPIKVCSLLPKADVKKHLPWNAIVDGMPPEEEAIGNCGSSCNYPSVTIQVMPFSQGIVDALRKQGALETIARVGDEAYFHNNRNRYAELYVRVGKRMLTLQANADGKIDAVKPGTLDLAKVLVAKLR
jgi:hypothetical protein